MPDVIIRGNKIDFVESASNLGVHITVIVEKVYGILRNLWDVIDTTPFTIHMQLARTFLVPVLLHGSEIFANCDTDDRRKVNLAYIIIARYAFIKGRRDHISQFSYRIFEINFDNLLNNKCLILLSLWNGRIRFARSNRGKKIIQYRHRTVLLQLQFFIHTISLWNTLPKYIQNIDNATKFKKKLYKLFK